MKKHRNLRPAVCALIILLGVLCHAAPIWAGGDVWYFILLDRFFDGDPGNNSEVDLSDPHGFHGGDLPGVLRKLDYLDDLGVTGLWVSPVARNRPMRFFKHQPYHGYWTWDFFSVDPRFGTLGQLQGLSDALHHRGKKLLLDLAVNHLGYDAPLASASPWLFHQTGNIKDWNDRAQVETGRLFGLPDFASEKGAVQAYFGTVAKFWIDAVRPDGFRLDAVKHVPLAFWRPFNERVRGLAGPRFILLGELMDGDPASLVRTLREGRFTSLFDFPLHYTLLDVIARGGDCRQLGLRFFQDFRYPDPESLSTFLDNHDTDRFITACKNDREKYMSALAMLLTLRGIPTLCYGNEQGLPGALEPDTDNRRDMEFGHDPEIYRFTRELIRLRRGNPALADGVQVPLLLEKQACVFARFTSTQQAIIVLNTSTAPARLSFPLWAPLPEGARCEATIGGGKPGMVHRGRFECEMGPATFSLYLFAVPNGKTWERVVAETREWKRKIDRFGRIPVTFVLSGCAISPGATVHPIGGLPDLGDWDTTRLAPAMKRIGSGTWELTMRLPAHAQFEYKFVVRDSNGKPMWQQGDNRFVWLSGKGKSRFLSRW